MDDGAPNQTDGAADFANDLAELGNDALRKKYRREANSHAAMKRRCADGTFSLDPAWNHFRDFLRDMGPQSSTDATIDRIDPVVRRYGPGLCRWATKAEQTINRSNTRWVDFRGERLRLQEFADRIGAKYTTVHGALARGDSPEAICARLKAEKSELGAFAPAWITNPEKLRAWRSDYERWRRTVRRDRRDLAHPEVYAAILASEALHQSSAFLQGKGLSEMTPDENAAARDRWPGHFRCHDQGIAWIKHALQALREKDRALTARLVPQHGGWTDLRLFELFLKPPVEV